MIYSLNHTAKTLVISTVLCLGLSGCIADQMAEEDLRYNPIQASERYPIKVVKGIETIGFSSRLGRLSANQINVAKGFAHGALTARAHSITISRPIAGGKSERVAGELANLLVAQGIAYRNLHFHGYAGPASGPVHLSYAGSKLVTKPCGDWSKDLGDTLDNAPFPNLGCAVQANIAAQIVHPDSLNTPLAPDMAPAGPGVLAVSTAMTRGTKTAAPTN